MNARSNGEGGLVWAIGASGLAHGAALALLALTPSRFEGMPVPPESYNVSLVAPSVVGGTQLPGSPAGRPAAPPRVEAPSSAPAKPKAAADPKPISKPKVESVKEPPPAAAAPPPKPPQPSKAEEAAKSEAKKVAEPKPKPKVDEVAAVQKPPPVVEPLDVRPKPKEKESAVPKRDDAVGEVKKEAPQKNVEAGKKPAAAPTATSEKAEAKPPTRDEQIAAAIARRAEEARANPTSQEGGQDEVDRRIAAAVQRRAKEAARAGSGIGSSDSTVASVGPGSGVGGAVRGIEYVMYRNQMESRIKAAWAWAGSDRSLRAVVRFNVTEEGRITNVTTVQPSGDPSYDASVERAIRAADPLGPPPEQYRTEFGTVELEFRAEDARG